MTSRCQWCGEDPLYVRYHDEGRPIRNSWKNMGEVPAKTKESDALSKDLSQGGFKFVGSTILYAYMQAVGMVNDHKSGYDSTA